MSAPAGWYDDGGGSFRWWDGQKWTEHVWGGAPQQPAAPGPDREAERRLKAKEAAAKQSAKVAEKQMKTEQRAAKQTEAQATRAAQKSAKEAEKQAAAEERAAKESELGNYPLGRGHGKIVDHKNGLVSYMPNPGLIPAFTVNLADVRGFSVRRATETDIKQLGAHLFHGTTKVLLQVIEVHGLGTTLGSALVHPRTAEKIRGWFEARPEFATNNSVAAAQVLPINPSPSTADEIAKLAELHRSGLLSEQEFAAAKARVLGPYLS